MPTYLLHGFRWDRTAISIYIILNNLDDAATGWIMAPATSLSILNSFYANYDFIPPSHPPRLENDVPIPPIPAEEKGETSKRQPLKKGRKASMGSLRSLGRKSRPANLTTGNTEKRVVDVPRTPQSRSTDTSISSILEKKEEEKSCPPKFNDWSMVKLVEQYDPDDMLVAIQPYAYVADYMVEVKLHASLAEEMAKYEAVAEQAHWSSGDTTSPADQKAEDGTVPRLPNGTAPSDHKRKAGKIAWIEQLNTALGQEPNIGWHVVYCGDEERASDIVGDNGIPPKEDENTYPSQTTPKSSGFRGFFKRNEE